MLAFFAPVFHYVKIKQQICTQRTYLMNLIKFTMKTKLIAAIAVLTLATGIQASAQQKDWAQLGRYAQANKEAAPSPKAVFMGDSITDGWDDADQPFFTDNGFICRGISGQTTSEMLVRFRQDVIGLHPKYVVILAGTNDIAMNNGFIALENVLGNLISMCELAKANRIRPILCSVTPSAGFGWRPEIKDAASRIEKLNGMIKAYAESEKIPYVDYHSALKDENGGLPATYSGDGVHPNLDCYKIMEKIIFEYL